LDLDPTSQLEELNRGFPRPHCRAHLADRTREQTTDPADPERVANGHRVGYTEDGDKVEWIPDDEQPGEVGPLLLHRNDTQILGAYKEFWDSICWNRDQNWRHRIESGKEPLNPELKVSFDVPPKQPQESRRSTDTTTSARVTSSGKLISGGLSPVSSVSHRTSAPAPTAIVESVMSAALTESRPRRS
jgi:hypothetical protein